MRTVKVVNSTTQRIKGISPKGTDNHTIPSNSSRQGSSHYNQIHFSLCLIGTIKYSSFTSATMKELL